VLQTVRAVLALALLTAGTRPALGEARRTAIVLEAGASSPQTLRRVTEELELIGLLVASASESAAAEASEPASVALRLRLSPLTSTATLVTLTLERAYHAPLVREATASAKTPAGLPAAEGIRAAELVRATLEEVALTALLRQVTTPPPRPRAPPPPPPAPRREPTAWAFRVEAGGFWMLSGSEEKDLAPAVSVGFGVPELAVRAGFTGPYDDELVAREGVARIQQIYVYAEANWFPLPRAELGPRIAAGLGAAHLNTGGEAAAGHTVAAESAWLPLAIAGIGLEWRALKGLRLSVDARLLSALVAPRVEHGGHTFRYASPGLLVGSSLAASF
jgi:hypothetical protein